MKKHLRNLLAAALWALFSGQSPAPGPTGPQLDSLLKHKKPAEAAALLRAFCAHDRQQKDWPALQAHLHRLNFLLAAENDFPEIERLNSEAISAMEAGAAHDSLTAKLYMWLGRTAREREDWATSLDCYRTAVRLFEKSGVRGSNLTKSLSFASQILVRFADYGEADQLFRRAISIAPSQRLFTQAANNSIWRDSLQQAVRYFEAAGKEPSEGSIYDAHLFATGGDIFSHLGDVTRTRQLYQKAATIYRGINGQSEHLLRCLSGLAEIERKTKNFKKAETLYAEAEATGRAYYKGRSREMAKLFTERGDAFLENNQPQKAGFYYQKALTEAWPSFSDEDFSKNPDPTNAPTEQWAMHAAARKAALLLKKPAPSPADRLNAAQCFDLAFAAAEKLRAAYGRDEAKLYLQNNNYNLRREAAINQWMTANDERQTADGRRDETLQKLFNIIEAGRAAVLRDALRDQKALENLHLPDSLLKKEAAFRKNRARVEKSLAEARATGDSAATAHLEASLFKIGQQQSDFTYFLEKERPDFARLRRASDLVDMAALQTELPDSTALLSWLDAGDRWLCATLRRDGIDCFEAKKEGPLAAASLDAFLKSLADRAGAEAAPAAFFEQSAALYRQLFGNAPPALFAAKEWVVLPDGPLNFLPFDALLTAPHSGSFGSAPWLLREKNIRLAWSASLLFSKREKGASGHSCLQMMPFLTKSRENWPALPASADELPEGLASKNLRDDEATTQFFWEKAHSFDVLHLSTHADPGAVQFADRAMPISEIYAARLAASLVVLSACETGTGRFSGGEGTLSLARAFAYAGARSLVASLWPVNDRSTARLFHDFYENLKTGATKSAALRRSKLEYLSAEGPDALKSPWYWAGFSFSGADEKLEIGRSGLPGWALWLGALAAVAGLSGLFFLKKGRGRGQLFQK